MGGLLGVLKGDPSETHEPLLRAIHLQEAADWRKELGAWEADDHASGALVALCRHWSERIAGRSPAPLGDALANAVLIELQRWLTTLNYPPEWQWALCVDGLPPDPLPIELARTTLDSYTDAWIEPSQSVPTEWDHETLYKRFLSLSISLDVLVQASAHDPRLRKLATHPPIKSPFFNGLDLWIQRRALRICVTNSGVRFIEENVAKLRDEAILSLIIGDQLAQCDLLELEAALRARTDNVANPGLDDLAEAIRLMVHRLHSMPGNPS